MFRIGFLAAPVSAAAAALYEYEDGASPFDWLHSILTSMSVTIATAASILTVCGLVLAPTARCVLHWLNHRAGKG